jgi:hypothetical protein
MSFFINPFKKHDVSEFPGVYVPMADAKRHPSVVAANERKLSMVDSNIEGNGYYFRFTIEALRAEVDSDIAASGHDTAYDRM